MFKSMLITSWELRGSGMLSNKINSLARSSQVVSQKKKAVNSLSQHLNLAIIIFFFLTISYVAVASRWTGGVITVVKISGAHREDSKSIVLLIAFSLCKIRIGKKMSFTFFSSLDDAQWILNLWEY